MADPNTRTGKRTPVTLKIKFKSETLEQFIERYAVDVSQGGIFIRTKEPLAVGTQMRFEFQLRDASPLIGGEGTVVWTRENDPSRPAIAPGMGVRFDRLAEGSQGVLERILAEKAKQAPQRPASDSIRPPLFTDTPTRVAPAPIQEQLLGAEKPNRRNEDSFNDQHTPLPKPMPFASDADEFPDEAFEEATKVRALDELVAQTADPNAPPTATPADELAERRGRPDSKAPEPGAARAGFTDGESIPGLPSPPETDASPLAAIAKGGGRLLDPTPSPRTEDSPVPLPAPSEGSARTKLGMGLEAPRMKSPSAVPAGGSSAGPGPSVGGPMSHATATARAPTPEPTSPVRKPVQSSGPPVALLVIVLLVVGAVGVWFFVLRDKGTEPTPGAGTGSAPISTGSDPGPGSDRMATGPGSDRMATGPGSAKVETPKAPLVDTVIDSNVPKSRIEVVDTDQKGESPFTAKLEKDRPYKVRISAPGYATVEADLVGGAPKHAAALVPKPRILSIKTDPPGASITIDGVAAPKTSPQDIELTKQQAAKPSLRLRLFKNGYKPVDKTIEAGKFTEDDARMITTVDEKLQAQAARPPGPGPGSNAAGSGSGTPTPTGGSGTPPPPPPGDGSGTAPPPPPPPAGGGSGTPP